MRREYLTNEVREYLIETRGGEGAKFFDECCDQYDREQLPFDLLEQEYKKTYKLPKFPLDYSVLQQLKAKLRDPRCTKKESARINSYVQIIEVDLGLKHKAKPFTKEMAKEVPMSRVLGNYQIETKRNQLSCPAHEDRHPSCHLYEHTDTIHCFSCGKTFDQISLVMFMENCNFKEALTFLKNLI